MKCPVCNTSDFSNFDFGDQMAGFKCESCEGNWIKGTQYWEWLKEHRDTLPEKTAEQAAALEVHDSKNAKVCLDCGHLMLKTKVGHGVSFHVDRCSACGGIWLDKNEWEILKSRNLHNEIHMMFTSVWQNSNRKEEQESNYENAMIEALGEKHFSELKTLKSWASSHPKKDMIFAYLLRDLKK